MHYEQINKFVLSSIGIHVYYVANLFILGARTKCKKLDITSMGQLSLESQVGHQKSSTQPLEKYKQEFH
jgi:hypothetical protein